jgi:large subunit ribosomal protein L6
MSRIASKPVVLPKGVELNLAGREIKAKGPKGEMAMQLHPEVELQIEDGTAKVTARSGSKFSVAMSGTTRALLNNLVTGVNEGFEKKLQLVGVGYRAKASAKSLNLTLGFSHPVNYTVPEGIEISTPSQTEIVVQGIDKQKVGQVAAEIRAYRPPEPYKGKGVRYFDEHVVRKEAKKK